MNVFNKNRGLKHHKLDDECETMTLRNLKRRSVQAPARSTSIESESSFESNFSFETRTSSGISYEISAPKGSILASSRSSSRKSLPASAGNLSVEFDLDEVLEAHRSNSRRQLVSSSHGEERSSEPIYASTDNEIKCPKLMPPRADTLSPRKVRRGVVSVEDPSESSDCASVLPGSTHTANSSGTAVPRTPRTRRNRHSARRNASEGSNSLPTSLPIDMPLTPSESPRPTKTNTNVSSESTVPPTPGRSKKASAKTRVKSLSKPELPKSPAMQSSPRVKKISYPEKNLLVSPRSPRRTLISPSSHHRRTLRKVDITSSPQCDLKSPQSIHEVFDAYDKLVIGFSDLSTIVSDADEFALE